MRPGRPASGSAPLLSPNHLQKRPHFGGERMSFGVRPRLNPLPMTDRKHIGFVVPVDMAAALEQKAASQDRSLSAELRVAVRAHLAKRNVPGQLQPRTFQGLFGSSPVGDQAQFQPRR